LLAGCTLSVGGPQPSSAPVDRAVLNQYCAGCHNAQVKSGGFALDALSTEHVGQQPEAWEKVVRKLSARYMPPIGIPRPDERTYDALVSSLSTSLDRAAASHPNPGRTDTFRRLNRTEYQNSLRDLLALDVDVSGLLPGDESSHGFDNVTVGDLSPTLLERYLSAAEKVSRLAVGIPGRSPAATPSTFRRTSRRNSTSTTFPSAPARFDRSLYVSAGCRIRDPRPAATGPQRARRRTHRGSRSGVDAGWPAAPIVHRQAASLGVDHHAVDQDVNIRIPVKAGPHLLAAAFPKRPSTLLETERQPTRRTSIWTVIRAFSRPFIPSQSTAL